MSTSGVKKSPVSYMELAPNPAGAPCDRKVEVDVYAFTSVIYRDDSYVLVILPVRICCGAHKPRPIGNATVQVQLNTHIAYAQWVRVDDVRSGQMGGETCQNLTKLMANLQHHLQWKMMRPSTLKRKEHDQMWLAYATDQWRQLTAPQGGIKPQSERERTCPAVARMVWVAVKAMMNFDGPLTYVNARPRNEHTPLDWASYSAVARTPLLEMRLEEQRLFRELCEDQERRNPPLGCVFDRETAAAADRAADAALDSDLCDDDDDETVIDLAKRRRT